MTMNSRLYKTLIQLSSLLIWLVLLCAMVSFSLDHEVEMVQDSTVNTDYSIDHTYKSIMDMEDEAYENNDIQRLRNLTEVHTEDKEIIKWLKEHNFNEND